MREAVAARVGGLEDGGDQLPDVTPDKHPDDEDRDACQLSLLPTLAITDGQRQRSADVYDVILHLVVDDVIVSNLSWNAVAAAAAEVGFLRSLFRRRRRRCRCRRVQGDFQEAVLMKSVQYKNQRQVWQKLSKELM